MPPKVSFLTAVWGEAYISRFASLSLPSFLAHGNLPALAGATELEVVIMTQSSDVRFFEDHPTFSLLRNICPVRFVAIDDLITTGNYGVTLTLAYLRPIALLGERMLETHFLFMNADFVLADGSLRSLAKHILAGRSIVLGPSFRATAEDVEPALRTLIDKQSGILTVPQRELVALSLAHPHPTTVAKTLNQAFCHTMHPNQFFWQVDENTVIGHYFLIFMLCLKPERVIRSINSYCDYAFIPELCPSGDEVVMDDSDDFFMLELQQLEQERALLYLGRASDKEIVRSLQLWTTAEHRRAAKYQIVFHSKDLPQNTEAVKAEAKAYIDRIQNDLGAPRPHAGHFYWVHGVAAWQHHRTRLGLSIAPPELAPTSEKLGGIRGMLARARGLLLRWSLSFMYASRPLFHKLRSTPLHPYWLDYRSLRALLQDLGSGVRPLFVQDYIGALDDFAARCPNSSLINIEVPSKQGTPSGAGFTHLIVYVTQENTFRIQEIIDHHKKFMTPKFECRVFIHNFNSAFEIRDFSTQLMHHIDRIIGQPPKNVLCSFVGGDLKRANTKFFLRLSGHYTHFGAPALLWIAPLMAVALPLTVLVNLYLSSTQPDSSNTKRCSSAALVFRENHNNLQP